MLPPSMIRNVSNGANSALQRSSGTSNISSCNNRLESNSVGSFQARRTITPPGTISSNNNINSNNNRNDLLQQLRLITSQLSGSSASPMTSAPNHSPTTTQQRNQSLNSQQTILRPEVPRSNVGIATTATVVNNASVGTMSTNPIDVDMGSSNSKITNTSPPDSDNDSQADLFPYILHGMLGDVERIGQTNIVSWKADGKSFRIHDPDAFVSFILGKYLKKYVGGIASRLTQFRSDLKDWGFEDVVDGNRMGESFTHHCFQKGQTNLVVT